MAAAGDEKGSEVLARSQRIWTFAGCVLDERSLELKVGGTVSDLDPKPLEVLLHLLRHAGEVVTKDELVEAVWPGRIITDANLTKTVARVRAALGEAEHAIKTVHGYGYRLVAPVSVQVPEGEPAPARFDFKPGESPPLRPHWLLDSRLGTGGHGEVWLAHHSGTGQLRVFKFAEEGRSLSALKREITLNRLLRETLPGRADFLHLLDWNVEEPPFFIECEHFAHGNLTAWAQAQGGWPAIPLATRLDLLAQLAEALAAAHSVGVLHKDLKPANVLVYESDGKPQLKLADFGSGGVLDAGSLEALGITRMGFTQTLQADGTTSGTPLYLAPEVIAGQPFTVQSDIYALAVMLYQLVAGDTRKALAPGWEKDVADELLREDIAQAAAGNPADRLGDAALLAHHLRTLDVRRQQREEERARQSHAERVQRMRGELKRLRAVAAVLLLLATAATAAGVIAFKARNAAEQAVATAEAVSQFLNKDLLAGADPRQGATRDLSVRQLLDRAAALVEERFQGQPETAARVHTVIGEAYLQLGEPQLSHDHLQAAVTLYGTTFGTQALQTLEARYLLTLAEQGLGEDACAATREVQGQIEAQVGPADERALGLRAEVAYCGADSAKSLQDVRAVIAALEGRGMTQGRWYARALQIAGELLQLRGDFSGAEVEQRKLVAHLSQTLGAHHLVTARRRADLAGTLINVGKLDQADAELSQAFDDHRSWGTEDFSGLPTWLTTLRMEQGRFAEAEAMALKTLNGPFGKAMAPSLLTQLSESLLCQGRLDEAIARATELVALAREQGLSPEWFGLPGRVVWADALRRKGQPAMAWQTLNAGDFAGLPRTSGARIAFRRVQGLLLAHDGKVPEARVALRDATDSMERLVGPESWRSKQVKKELEALDGD
jgi:DNA-binding winged helix-turn-helix (wHTH) protein/tetratricopeptide (TPR) repeat protein